MPAKDICQEPGCDYPVLKDYAYCPRHVLLSTRCIVPGCKHERLYPDLTCWAHLLDDARCVEPDEDTQPVSIEAHEMVARGAAR